MLRKLTKDEFVELYMLHQQRSKRKVSSIEKDKGKLVRSNGYFNYYQKIV